jgi:hypothetical protein
MTSAPVSLIYINWSNNTRPERLEYFVSPANKMVGVYGGGRMIARWKGDENTRRKADVKPEGKAPRNW